MHSTIYQISTEPIAENDYLNIDRTVAGENASISYVCENTEDGRKFDIRFLLEHILPKEFAKENRYNSIRLNSNIFNKLTV